MAAGWAGDVRVLETAGTVIAAIRKAKSEARQSMRVPVSVVVVRGPAPTLESLRLASADIRAAGNVATLSLEPDTRPDPLVEVVLKDSGFSAPRAGA